MALTYPQSVEGYALLNVRTIITIYLSIESVIIFRLMFPFLFRCVILLIFIPDSFLYHLNSSTTFALLCYMLHPA